MIRAAHSHEIDELMELTKACAAKMIAQNIYQWNEHYPHKDAFLNDLERNELYVFELENRIAGCVVISTHKDVEYESVAWLTPDGNNIYIHRLAVHPDFQGKGLAQRMMDFAEQEALVQNRTSIRLDTFSQNLRNQKFYEQRGYKKLGDIYFPKQSEHPFHCYELPLSAN